MLNVARLRILREVAHRGSISAAASALTYTQSAVSQQIAALESETGLTLLERHRFGVNATPYAELLVAHARSIDQELDGAWSNIARLKGSEVVSLRIGCGPAEATRLLPMALIQRRRSR